MTVSGRLRERLHQLTGWSHYAVNLADRSPIDCMARTSAFVPKGFEHYDPKAWSCCGNSGCRTQYFHDFFSTACGCCKWSWGSETCVRRDDDRSGRDNEGRKIYSASEVLAV